MLLTKLEPYMQQLSIRNERATQTLRSQEFPPSTQIVKSVQPVTPSAALSATQEFDWGRLPAEIRLIVLEYLLSFPRGITEKNNDFFIRMRVLPLLVTKDTNFAAAVKSSYFGLKTFRVTPEAIAIGRNPALRIGQHIRHLEIVMLSLSEWQLAMLKKTDWKKEWLTTWEGNLPSLQTLDVIFKIRDSHDYTTDLDWSDDKRGLLYEHSLEMYSATLKPKVAALCPKQFNFIVDCGDRCPYPYRLSLHTGTGCTCAREFEKNMVKLITAL